MKNLQDRVRARVVSGKALDEEGALAVLSWPDADMERLLELTRTVRRRNFGALVECCGIVNARSGRCGEDCRYCAQSAHFATGVDVYPLLSSKTLLEARTGFPEELKGRFGIVTSGGALEKGELDNILEVIRCHGDAPVDWCASLGMLGEPDFRRLYAAGLRRYHHNLETAESHFESVCSTHSFADRVATVTAAKKAGLEVCCGALFGLGETPRQRVEIAFQIRDLDVDAIPLNFLMPVEGTPLAAEPPRFTPLDVLRIVAMVRLVCPETHVKLCAGRERYLGEEMDRIFDAGATGMMIGGYLTTRGRAVAEDLAMIERAGYVPEWSGA